MHGRETLKPGVYTESLLSTHINNYLALKMKAYKTDHMAHHLTNPSESFSQPAYDLSELLLQCTFVAQAYVCTHNIVSGGGCGYLMIIARAGVSVRLGMDKYKARK